MSASGAARPRLSLSLGAASVGPRRHPQGAINLLRARPRSEAKRLRALSTITCEALALTLGGAGGTLVPPERARRVTAIAMESTVKDGFV